CFPPSLAGEGRWGTLAPRRCCSPSPARGGGPGWGPRPSRLKPLLHAHLLQERLRPRLPGRAHLALTRASSAPRHTARHGGPTPPPWRPAVPAAGRARRLGAVVGRAARARALESVGAAAHRRGAEPAHALQARSRRQRPRRRWRTGSPATAAASTTPSASRAPAWRWANPSP